MKLLTVLVLLALGLWLPVAFMEAAQREVHIRDAEADRALVARLGR